MDISKSADKVRIVSTPETQASGHAGKLGAFVGYATPSVDNVQVIGQVPDDFAYHIVFEDNTDAWFASGTLEFLPSPSILDLAPAEGQPDNPPPSNRPPAGPSASANPDTGELSISH